MTKAIFIITMLLGSIKMFAQQEYDRQKMSDYLCSLISSPSTRHAKGVNAKHPAVTVLMKLNDGSDIHAVTEGNGCHAIDSIGQIYIVRAPIDNLGQLSLDDRVKRIDAHEMPRPTMDETPTRVGAAKAWSGKTPLPQAFTGEGVLAGVVDIGFDFTHPMFIDAEGNSRILQFIAPVEDDEGELQWNTYNSQEVMDLQHSPFATYQYHGTHVASIMAGSAVTGQKGTYSGIAPESDLMIVELGTDSVGSTTALATTADLVLYCKKIFDEADALNRPCVVNLSAGAYVPITADMSTEDEAIESMLGPGRIFVTSAGNLGGAAATMTKKAEEEEVMATFYGTESDTDTISTQSQAERIDCYLLTEYPQKVEFHLEYGSVWWDNHPSKTITIKTDSIDVLHDICVINDSTDDFYTTIKAYKVINPHGKTTLYCFLLDLDLSNSWLFSRHSFSWFLGIAGISISIVSDYPCTMYTNPMYTPFTLVKNFKTGEYNECISYAHTIDWPASTCNVITAGAMNRGKSLAYFSSQGPNWDNQIKPDVVAPGVNIRAAYNQYYGSIESNAYDSFTDADGAPHYMLATSGTSMSSPVVAGAIALWLQAEPDLTPAEIKEVLAETCSHPEEEEDYPNNRYGYGEIDVYRGLLHILGLSDKVEDLSAHQPASLRFQLNGRLLTVLNVDDLAPLEAPLTLTVYATDGRKIVTASNSTLDLSHLPSGVYAVQVKTNKPETTGSTLIRLN